jgi:hypothetical protein
VPTRPGAVHARRGASVADPDELQALVEVARLDRKQRLGNPSGRLVDLRPPELADWPFANRHARPFLAVSAAKQQPSLHLVRPSCAAPRCSRSEHQTRTLWQFYRCRCSTRRNRPAGNRSDEFGPCRGADRLASPTGVSLGFLAEILPFQTLSELRTVA